MMIGLSSILADASGDIVFELLPSSDVSATTRRVSRVKTLDGGCVIVDGGYSDSDRTLNIKAEYNEDRLTTIRHLHEDKTLIYIAFEENFYSGTISSVKLGRGTQETIQIQILIKEKISE